MKFRGYKVAETTREEIQEILGKEMPEFKGNTEQENMAVVHFLYPDIIEPQLRAFPETDYKIFEIWDYGVEWEEDDN